MRIIRTRRGQAVVLIGAAVLGGIIFGVSRSQTAGAAAAPLGAVQSYLAEYQYIHVDTLPASTAVATSEQDAEGTALQHFGVPGMAGVTSALVSATNSVYCKVQGDGTCSLVISNRPVWMVLIPHQQVPITGPPGYTGADSYTATMAVLIDANTGEYLEAAAVPSS